METKLTYSVAEAAQRLGLNRDTAYRAVHSGTIPSLRIGGRLLIPRAALDKMLERAGEPGPKAV
jgi:excisionase family DNA binding protein